MLRCPKQARTRVIVSRIWTWIAANDRTLLVVFGAVAGVYALVVYTIKANYDKTIETVKFVELYASPPILTARMDLRAFMNSSEIRQLNDDTYPAFVKSKIDDDKLVRNVFTHLGFFDALSFCVENDVCAKGLACQHFFDDGQAFIENMRPLLAELSDLSPIDISLKHFVHDHCIDEFHGYCKKTPVSHDCGSRVSKSGAV
jgi:hypothetical protein